MLLNVFKFNVDSIGFGSVFGLFLAIDKTRPELIRIAISFNIIFNCFFFLSFSNKIFQRFYLKIILVLCFYDLERANSVSRKDVCDVNG